MTISRLKKEGWFDDSFEEIDLTDSMSEDQIRKLKKREEIIVEKDGDSYLLYIRDSVDTNKITPKDLIIRKIPRQ